MAAEKIWTFYGLRTLGKHIFACFALIKTTAICSSQPQSGRSITNLRPVAQKIHSQENWSAFTRLKFQQDNLDLKSSNGIHF